LNNLPSDHPGFNNLLIVSVAGDFDSRALLEQQLAVTVSDDESSATAYYTVVGRQPQLTRTALSNAILSRRFDAVLFTRLKGQEQNDLEQERPVGPAFDLFDYDYAELNIPVSIDQAQAITFVTELYSTADQEKVWSIDSLSIDKTSAADLINDQAAMIAGQIIHDNLLRR